MNQTNPPLDKENHVLNLCPIMVLTFLFRIFCGKEDEMQMNEEVVHGNFWGLEKNNVQFTINTSLQFAENT